MHVLVKKGPDVRMVLNGTTPFKSEKGVESIRKMVKLMNDLCRASCLRIGYPNILMGSGKGGHTMKKLTVYSMALAMLLPVTAFGQGPDHKAKQAIKDATRLSEGQKRQAMKNVQGKDGGYGAQDRNTKRTLQSMEKGTEGRKQQ